MPDVALTNLSTRHRRLWVRWWHSGLIALFCVAWLSGDEDSYTLHQWAGYAVLILAGLRLASRWPRPGVGAAAARHAKGGAVLFGRLALAVLAGTVLAALSGVLADGVVWLEHPHEALATVALWLAVGHVSLTVMRRVRRHSLFVDPMS